ncbi:hypothetical protein [Stieleria marina]|uniref:Uncharacterized protein n=1 Tax=Stieleria marina TaxID=1930275 RepID=A0A517NMZ3_9BACT|nr:hypothetical protein K239x_04280 [Planctomycetes bacterium K23_9]
MDDTLRIDARALRLIASMTLALATSLTQSSVGQEAAVPTAPAVVAASQGVAAAQSVAVPTATPQPQLLRGPAGSQLASVRPAPSYASAFGSFLGLSNRQSSNAELNQYYRSTSRRRLVKVPEMFGDFRRFNSVLAYRTGSQDLTGDLPHAGGVSGLKVAENNQAITSDRAWISYSHMHDAYSQSNGLGQSSDASADRFLLGIEKTFADGAWSLEARLPLAGSLDDDAFDGGTMGDVSLILKHLLYAGQCRATSMGLGIELPTGDDGRLLNRSVETVLESDAVHLVPFFASTNRMGARIFGHLFAQLDIPLGDDDLIVNDVAFATTNASVDAAFTGSIDLGIGYWLLPPNSVADSGLAAIAELHYTSRLDSTDPVVFPGTSINTTTIHPGGEAITDVLNITTGLHAELSGEWAMRLASSVPVTNDKLFDTEIIVQLNRKF